MPECSGAVVGANTVNNWLLVIGILVVVALFPKGRKLDLKVGSLLGRGVLNVVVVVVLIVVVLVVVVVVVVVEVVVLVVVETVGRSMVGVTVTASVTFMNLILDLKISGVAVVLGGEDSDSLADVAIGARTRGPARWRMELMVGGGGAGLWRGVGW